MPSQTKLVTGPVIASRTPNYGHPATSPLVAGLGQADTALGWRSQPR